MYGWDDDDGDDGERSRKIVRVIVVANGILTQYNAEVIKHSVLIFSQL